MTAARPPQSSIRVLAPGMRRLLLVAGLLVFIAGVQLFVFSERTADYFAWTIDVPLTAAFLGAGYWASVVLEWVAAGQRAWIHARISVLAVLIFTTLTLVATVLHLDLFHLGSEFDLVTRIATWGWLAIYALVPPAMILLLLVQAKAPGEDPRTTAPLPKWVSGVLFVHAAVMLSVGAYLFIVPETAASLWPWPLTPLTGRAVGAWVFSIGIAAAHSIWENDLRRMRPAAMSYIALAVLQLIALARFPDPVLWGEPQTLIYLALVASMLVVGVAAAALDRGGRMAPAIR